MLEFNPSFRRMVLRFIPQLRAIDLDRHESLIALRLQRMLEMRIIRSPNLSAPPPLPAFDRDPIINAATTQANQILAPYKRQYEAALRLYMSRRRLALQQGHFWQIPGSREKMAAYMAALGHFWMEGVRSYPLLELNRISYYAPRIVRWLVVAGALGALLWGSQTLVCTPAKPPAQRPPVVAPPDSSLTQKQTSKDTSTIATKNPE